MQITTKLAIYTYANKVVKSEEQAEYTLLVCELLKINQEVYVNGIAELESYENDMKLPFLLRKGLAMVRTGLEPDIIESVLLNIVLTNKLDFLSSVVIIDAVLSIQQLLEPGITREILLSYFVLDDVIAVKNETMDIKYNFSQNLSKQEIHNLIDQEQKHNHN